MKYIAVLTILTLGIATMFLSGCTAMDILKNNADLCSLINCASVGIVDIAGPHNPLVPSQPDYSRDPSCSLPGMCGPSIWYPFSTGAASTAKAR